MSDEPEQLSSSEWRLTVDELGTSIRVGQLPTIHCRIRVTTPDQDPVLVTLRMEVQLKNGRLCPMTSSPRRSTS
jgi:hypothetical protein